MWRSASNCTYEGKNPPLGSDLTGQKERIDAVAGGEIDSQITGFEHFGHEPLHPAHHADQEGSRKVFRIGFSSDRLHPHPDGRVRDGLVS